MWKIASAALSRREKTKTMKKAYSKPELTEFGTIESLTQLFNVSSASDTGFLNGNPIITGHGSVDGIFVPCSLPGVSC